MKRFWSYHGWEALFCLAASVALVLNFAQGFYIPDAVADSIPLAVLICGLTLAYAYLGSYNKTTMVCFSLGFLVIAAGFFFWLRNAGIDIIDQEGSPTAVYIYYIAAPLITMAAFLLSRSRIGIAVLFLAGACLHALIAFLGYDVKLWCAALFVAALAALLPLRHYRIAALHSHTVNPNFTGFFILSAVVGAAGIALALAFWGAVIRPLQPPTLDVELLTKYMRYEILEMVGIAQQYPLPDDQQTETPPDQTLLAQEPEPEESDAPPEETSAAPEVRPPDEGISQPNISQELSSVRYDRNMTGWLALLIGFVVLLIVLIPVFWRLRRKRLLAALVKGSPVEQVSGLYRFYLKKFARIGYPRSPAQTELEYMARCGEQLAPYLQGGPSLERMTALYLDVRYGGLPPSEADCQAMAQLYPLFLRNYRILAGRARYLRKYFSL